MKLFKDAIAQAVQEYKQSLELADSFEKLESVRITFLGRSGKIADLTDQFKKMPTQEKRVHGPLLQSLKQDAQKLLEEKKELLTKSSRTQEELGQAQFDVTASYIPSTQGSEHVYTQVINKLCDTFTSMGYTTVDGPEVEADYYNFQALNIPKDHPARDMQDTFWMHLPGHLMRTHTSPAQIHMMESHPLPLAIFSPGRVYRNEETDASHDYMFMQGEALLVDKNISLSHLLATAKAFLRAFFEKRDLQIRVRPGYFPFVEPGLEIDGSCPFCKNGCSVCKKTGWIELLGSGLIHPNVLRTSGIDPEKQSGFAFGFGIERLAMIKYGIRDIRLFHSSKIGFLKQF